MRKVLLVFYFLLMNYSCDHKNRTTEVINSHLPINENICQYTNETETLGIGILAWDSNKDCKISILDENKQNEILKANLCRDTHLNVCPYFYKPDYGIVHFIVLEEQSKFYKIIYNYNKKGYISKQEPFVYKSWKRYLMNLPLGAKLKEDTVYFEILDVRDDFLLKNNNEWIKWKNENMLLIEFSFLM